MVQSVMQSISSVAIYLTANSLLRLMECGVIYLGRSVVSHNDRYLALRCFWYNVSDLFQIGFTEALQLYADDAVLTYGEASVEEHERRIRHDLNSLHTRLAASSRLSMNIS
jgi:hypothetical protein